jgi:flavin-dependent dehydrogenase
VNVPATLTLAEAARRTWDAAVVGAGPAGALAARELSRRGMAVLLIDKALFPRPKVCGCCLNGRALAALRSAGLTGLPAACGAVPLQAIELTARGHSARLPLGGVALSRQTFDAALVHSAVAAGTAFLPGTLARLRTPAAQGPLLHLAQGDDHADVAARVLVAADGLGGALLAPAGMRSHAASGARVGAGVVVSDVPGFYRRGIVYMACGRPGYLGLVRLEDGRLDLAAALDADAVRHHGGPAGVAAHLLAETGWPPPPDLERQHWRGTPPLTRGIAVPGAERLFVVGDAAGYVEPFTGEGMAWALAGAVALAPVAARAAAAWRPSLLAEWRALHAQVVRRRQLACRIAAAVLRRPRLVGLLVRLLNRAPGLAIPVVRHLHGGRLVVE